MPNEVMPPQAIAPAPVTHGAIPMAITEYPGPGTRGKQWLRIIKMYADEYKWSPEKFLDVAQVRATGELYHKLEGLVVMENSTVDIIYDQVLELITPKANLCDTLYAFQRDGLRPNESMEALASRVKVLMKQYAKATDSTFGPSYHVDVFINMIKDKEMSMYLRSRSPKSLEDAVEFAAKWVQDKKNVENACATSAPPPTFHQFREPEAEPMEVDQLRFKPRRFDTRFENRRPQRQNRFASHAPARATSASPVVCFACNEKGHTGNSCPELRRCKDIIAKYKQKLDERSGKFERSFRPPPQESKERKLRRVTRLVQELELQDNNEQTSDSSDFSDVEEDDEPNPQTDTNTERADPAVQDF